MKNMEEQIRVTPCLVCIPYFIKHLFGSETRTHVDVGLITKLYLSLVPGPSLPSPRGSGLGTKLVSHCMTGHD